MDFLVILFIALVIGVVLGFLFQRSQFCMTLILTDSVFFKNHRRLIGLISVILMSTVLFNISIFFNFITQFNLLEDIGVNPNFFQHPLVIERSLVGGLLFGFGMILAGGCVAGILFRIGEGQLSSLISFLGLMVGFAIAIIFEVIGLIGSERSLYPSETLLPQIFQIPPLLLVTLVSVFLLTIILALRRGASWKILIVIIIIFVLATSISHYIIRTESIQLTAGQVQVDRFVNEFHLTLDNRLARVLSFSIARY